MNTKFFLLIKISCSNNLGDLFIVMWQVCPEAEFQDTSVTMLLIQMNN